MERMVKEQVAAKMAKQISEQSADEPTVQQLDSDDGLRLDNLLLKRRVEELVQELENKRRVEAKNFLADEHRGFQNYLASKYGVDLKTHTFRVDGDAQTLTIKALD